MLSITFSYFHYKNLVATSPPQPMKVLSSYFQGMSPKGWVNMIIGPFYWILKTKPFHGCSKRCIMNIHKGTLGVEPRTCRTAAGCSTTELYPLCCTGVGRSLCHSCYCDAVPQLIQMEKGFLSGMGFEPMPSIEDQNSHTHSLSESKDWTLSLAP